MPDSQFEEAALRRVFVKTGIETQNGPDMRGATNFPLRHPGRRESVATAVSRIAGLGHVYLDPCPVRVQGPFGFRPSPQPLSGGVTLMIRST